MDFFSFCLRIIVFVLCCGKTFAAIATFSTSNTGVSGFIKVDNHQVTVQLDVSHINSSKLPVSNCFTNGIKYHVHDKWAYSDSNDRIGAAACGTGFAGFHFDPWGACSAATGNKHCLSFKGTSSAKCIKSSSAFTTSGNYTCNSTVYASNPFSCEVGDFTGKYGVLKLTNNKVSRTDSSFWELESSDVIGKSVVFHCSTAGEPRAFCGLFRSESSSTIQTEIDQPNDSVMANFGVLSDDSNMIFYKNGVYNISLDFSYTDLNCTNMKYFIYDAWHSTRSTSFLGSDCTNMIGKTFDPSIACLQDSDSKFCFSGHACNDATSKYSCNFATQPFNCSPSDLSGKYGAIDVSEDYQVSINGHDRLMIPLNLIKNKKSAVLKCSDSGEIVACAKFTATD